MGTVLIIDDSRDVSGLVDEGFAVSILPGGSSETIRAAVADPEPDCIPLDGKTPLGYDASWANAALLTKRVFG
jgi:hypothetical protein